MRKSWGPSIVLMSLGRLPCTSAEPPICRAHPKDRSASASHSGLSVSERYFDLVECSKTPHELDGELNHGSFLVSRLQPDLHRFDWLTLARSWAWSGGNGTATEARAPVLLLPYEWHLSHNVAMLCVNGTLHVFGGQYRNYTSGRGTHARGVYHASAPVAALSSPPPAGEDGGSSSRPRATHSRSAVQNLSSIWGPRRLQLEGFAAGCIERRTKFAPYCEFDGKLSAVHFRGRFLLFARANLGAQGGARHVQMASIDAPLLGSWSTFRLVQLPGVHAGRPDANIYFFTVQTIRLSSGEEVLLALFPAVLPVSSMASSPVVPAASAPLTGKDERSLKAAERERTHEKEKLRLEAGIYASTSTDGVHWSRPQRLLKTAHSCARTRVHPVKLVVVQQPQSHDRGSNTTGSSTTSSTTSEGGRSGALHARLLLLYNVDISEPGDVPTGLPHIPGATRPYLRWLDVSLEIVPSPLRLDFDPPAASFRVNEGDGEELGREEEEEARKGEKEEEGHGVQSRESRGHEAHAQPYEAHTQPQLGSRDVSVAILSSSDVLALMPTAAQQVRAAGETRPKPKAEFWRETPESAPSPPPSPPLPPPPPSSHSIGDPADGKALATELPPPSPPCCVMPHTNNPRPHFVRCQHAPCLPVLAFLASRLHILTYLTAGDAEAPMKLRHWLRHYHNLGAWPNQTHVALRLGGTGRGGGLGGGGGGSREGSAVDVSNGIGSGNARGESSNTLLECLAVLAEARVPAHNVQRIHAAQSDSVKMAVMNERVGSLPPGHWHVYADVDELIDYPCNLQALVGSRLHPIRCLVGTMWDQVSPARSIHDTCDWHHQLVSRLPFKRSALILS